MALLPIGVFLGLISYQIGCHYGFGLQTGSIFVICILLVILCAWRALTNLRRAYRLAPNKRGKYAVVATFAVGIAAICFLSFPFFSEPIGARWVPAEEPNEARRVFHPKGFSIVAPPGWKVRVWDFDLSAGISLFPGSKARHGPGLGVCKIPEAPDLSLYNETELNGEKAFERTIVNTGENGRLSYWLLVPHDSGWYEVNYSESIAFESDPNTNFPKIILHYLHSFKPPP